MTSTKHFFLAASRLCCTGYRCGQLDRHPSGAGGGHGEPRRSASHNRQIAFDYLYDLPTAYFLVGGSDSQLEDVRLAELDKADRLLLPDSGDGYAPGEAAGLLLLTRDPALAVVVNGHRVVIHPPGIAAAPPIHIIYSSMNGEHYWTKEYGVAYIRNRQAFTDPVTLQHPADCYGDIGSATAPVLIALAAQEL